jgi:hypothetical protein
MPGHGMAFALAVLTICPLGAIAGFFISTGRAIEKFKSLDSDTQDKLLLLDYYMAAVRNFSRGDLIRLGRLPDKTLQRFNRIQNYDRRLRIIRRKLDKS